MITYAQMIMREQDRTLDKITGTLTTLTEQAGLMGREIDEHNEYALKSLAMLISPDGKLFYDEIGCCRIWNRELIERTVNSAGR